MTHSLADTGTPAPGGSPTATPQPDQPFVWSDLDRRAVDTARVLAMDAVESVGNGHPGTAMALAPAAYLLFQRHLRHDPADPQWPGRDRFVLSMGHSSLTLYCQLYLSGYDVTLDDLRSLRRWGSRTPGHPERGHTPGVETTTGPLGQGVGNAVGLALAARRVRGLLDPAAAPGASPFDTTVWVFASDGDLQEGVSAEASSFAGAQQLGNLVLVWDDNRISIEDDTAITFTEDVVARYRAYGWSVHEVDLAPDGDIDVAALDRVFHAVRREAGPSFVRLRSQIAWPAPTARNTGKAHGAALGAAEIADTKRALGLDPDTSFAVDEEAVSHARQVAERGAALRAGWEQHYRRWAQANPEGAELDSRISAGRLPEGWDDDLPRFSAGENVATRAASGQALAALAPVLPELWGGSADLAGSNNTSMPGEPSVLPAGTTTRMWEGSPYGRTLHFGVREHAMGALCNGIALEGRTRPYCGTFLVFSDYMRPAVRMAALMGLPTVYVWTHDSIGVGEDGPTHQPIEHLAALRVIPGLSVVRPADANETVAAWRSTLERREGPVALALTRQGVPVLNGTRERAADGVARGGYALADTPSGSPDLLLLATGSEVQLAVGAQPLLEAAGIATRVVSLPCLEWFERQPAAYQESVLPTAVRARVAVEAATPVSWHRWVGDHGRIVGIDHYGASADAATLFREFGFTVEAVVAAGQESWQATR